MNFEDCILTEAGMEGMGWIKVGLPLKVERLRDDVILPKYEHVGDACMDLRVILEGEDPEKEQVIIKPNGNYIFRTGIKCNIPKEHVMLIFPRSGLGIKKGVTLRNLTGVIDSGFTEEIKVCLVNNGTEDVIVKNNDRVAQFMLVPYPTVSVIEVDKVEDYGRGEGLGSSGVK